MCVCADLIFLDKHSIVSAFVEIFLFPLNGFDTLSKSICHICMNLLLDSWFDSIDITVCCCLVAKSCLTLWTAAHQASLPSPTPGAYSNSCPLSWWRHPTFSSSFIPFSSCLQSFPASGSFQMNQLFASGGQSIGVSASASVLPMNAQEWFPLGWCLV